MRRFFSASVIGPGHVSDGLPNQDYQLHRQAQHCWCAVVCDGMGSRPDSGIGSREAAKAVWASVKSLPFDVPDKVLVQTFYQGWLQQLKLLNIGAADAVTTCLLVWGLPDGRFRYAHLGDGLLASPRGVISECEDERFSNETTGLGISRQLSDWRFGVGSLKDYGGCLVLMTDGISEDLTDVSAFTACLAGTLKTKSYRVGKRWLNRLCNDWPTPGHSDDKTIVVVHCL
ncbi:Serine/threonine protein phosphatase PrpC [Thalassolituus maritimus]|uniref:Serine/threonine protein phosphatase PrpC n=1 Tax=Thalassolituus maritimus TaxID=484498 RepID=A0A1N7PBY4_9GAMM|nr:PP2C family serine/threonine-protein phosphatase [Thalassolituus maritimus]SIT08145.1 Serine/threonine protein phosphatase PrpC [Thalassolituus maritimus]